MAGASGRKARWIRVQHSSLLCPLWNDPNPRPCRRKKIPLPSEQRKLFDCEADMTIQSTLLFSALLAVTAASVYSYVGWRLSKRVISSSEARMAWQSFTIWWYGLAATTLISGLLNLFGAVGLTSLPLFIIATYLNILVTCIALLGLLYYL